MKYTKRPRMVSSQVWQWEKKVGAVALMKKILSLRSMPRLRMANLYLLRVYSTAAACFKQVLVCYFGTYSTCRVRCIHYTVQDGLDCHCKGRSWCHKEKMDWFLVDDQHTMSEPLHFLPASLLLDPWNDNTQTKLTVSKLSNHTNQQISR